MESCLHESITSCQVEIPGLSIHILHCGDPKNNIILLLHGFPELAFSWRKVLPFLAQAGYFVIAPDMRGYGRTVSTDSEPASNSDLQYHDGIGGFGMIDTISEILSLMYAIFREFKSARNVVSCGWP